MVSKPSCGIDKYDWLLVRYASYYIFHSLHLLHSGYDLLRFWGKQLSRSAHTSILDVPDTARWAWCGRWLRIWKHKALASFSTFISFISDLHPNVAKWHVPFNQFIKKLWYQLDFTNLGLLVADYKKVESNRRIWELQPFSRKASARWASTSQPWRRSGKPLGGP